MPLLRDRNRRTDRYLIGARGSSGDHEPQMNAFTNTEPEAGLRTQLIRGVTGSFGLKVVHTLLNFAISIVLARTLAPEGYGIYAFAFSVVALLAVPVQMGLPTLVIREVARYEFARRWDHLRGILQRANQAVLFFSLLVGLTALMLGWWFFENMEPTQRATLAWALLLLPLVAFNRLREAALQGLRRVVVGQFPDMVLVPLVFLGLLFAAYAAQGLTPPLAMALYALSVAMAFLVGSFLLVRALPDGVRTVAPRYETRAWLRSVLPLSMLGGLSVINAQTDIFMLGLLSTSENVGLYRIAFSGAALVLFTLTAVNAVLAPHVARLYKAGDTERLQKLVTRSVQITFVAALPVVLVFVVFGGALLEFVFGVDFRPSWGALAILSMAQLVNVAVGSVHVILNMTGYERETMKGAFYAAVLNVVLNALLIPQFGIEGAAVATGISIMAVNVILLRVLWNRTGIWSFVVRWPNRRRVYEQ